MSCRMAVESQTGRNDSSAILQLILELAAVEGAVE